MNILKKSENITPKELYLLTKSSKGRGMREVVGQKIDIAAWVIYEDVRSESGELSKICSILTREGEIYATNSRTFTEDFADIVDMFGGDVHAIQVVERKSKKNRPVLFAEYAE